MKKITFNRIVPHVLSKAAHLQSEVWNSNITFEQGCTYLVEAESGKGKSTLCSYIIGYRNDFAGSIFFNNADIKTFNKNKWSEIRRLNISMLFQELRLFPELTALENVLIKNQLTNHLAPSKISEYFERLGIADKQDKRTSQLSFGQQQRVAMIRALAQPFDFILADEPISHLDDLNSQVMTGIMLEESKRQGAGIIVTSIGKHPDISYDKIVKL